MTLQMLKGKIHRATVIQAALDYVGSITIDEDLLDAAGILEYEKVQIVDVNNGARFETYTIAGERGSGMICLNGAAARCASVKDKVIIMSYADMTPEEAKAYLHEVSSRQEWVALKKLNERLKKMEEDNENLKSELTSTMTKYEKDREELVILRGEKKVLEKKISDTAMSLEEHEKEIESLRMQAEDMEMKYKNKITTMQKELREAKDREVESKEKTTDLESQIRIAEDKHREEVRNLVRERDVFQKELEKRKRRIIFHRKKGEKEKQRFFELVVSGKLSAEQTSQLVNGLKESIPLEVLLTVARPENSAALMEQMMECYKNLSVFEEPESKEDAEYAK